jgi:carbon monoxide dehydrogenase subunit G
MNIETSFDIQVSIEHALVVLTDVPMIAPCIPGVTLTEDCGDRLYKGVARVRLGPVALKFSGKARIVDIDRQLNTVQMEADGADEKGRGRAGAKIIFKLSPNDVGTRVYVLSDITLSGQIAQYGRASGLINEVANQIILEFTKNLEAKLGQVNLAGSGNHWNFSSGNVVAVEEPISESTAGFFSETVVTQSTFKPAEISGFRVLFRALRKMIVRFFRQES